VRGRIYFQMSGNRARHASNTDTLYCKMFHDLVTCIPRLRVGPLAFSQMTLLRDEKHFSRVLHTELRWRTTFRGYAGIVLKVFVLVLLFSFPPQRHLPSSRNASSLSLLVSFSLSLFLFKNGLTFISRDATTACLAFRNLIFTGV